MKKIRWVKQRDESSCGPVVIINILKWLGHKITYDFINIAREACNWEDARSSTGGGTTTIDMEKALKFFNIKKIRKINPTLKEIDKHIDCGGIVVVNYIVNQKTLDGHLTLCIGRTKNYYILVNDGNVDTIGKRSRNVMKKRLSDKGTFRGWAWFINK